VGSTRVRIAMQDITDDVSAKYRGDDRQSDYTSGPSVFFAMLARLARI
jgi:hypothetical protein